MSITLVAVGNGGYNLASDIKNANLFTETKLIVCDTDKNLRTMLRKPMRVFVLMKYAKQSQI